MKWILLILTLTRYSTEPSFVELYQFETEQECRKALQSFAITEGQYDNQVVRRKVCLQGFTQ